MQREVTKDTNVKSQGSSEGSTAAIRKRHLEVKFGKLSGETTHVKVRGDHRSGKYGHCAEEGLVVESCGKYPEIYGAQSHGIVLERIRGTIMVR